MTAIQSKFMTPATNSSAINTQQQPTQKEPWRKPSRIAIVALDGLSTAPHGERQRTRQVCFNGVNWKNPAIATPTNAAQFANCASGNFHSPLKISVLGRYSLTI